jgi:taurine dioxygenase
MDVQPMAPFGARVEGFDPALVATARDEVVALLRDHALLVFAGAPWSVEQQIALVDFVGPLLDEGRRGAFHSHISHDPEVAPVIAAEGVFVGPLSFHSDLTYTSTPPEVLSLHALELPSDGSTTRFANAALALATLPAALRAEIDGRTVRHVFDASVDEYGGRYRESELGARHFAVEHPCVVRNQRTGRDVLFVNELLCDRVVGMDRASSERLLDALFAHLYTDDHVYAHHWQPNDLVVWENREVQHARAEFDRTQRRILRRVIAGDAAANERHGDEFHAQLAGLPGGIATM